MFQEPQLVAKIFAPENAKAKSSSETDSNKPVPQAVQDAIDETAALERAAQKSWHQQRFFVAAPPSETGSAEFAIAEERFKLSAAHQQLLAMENNLRNSEAERRAHWERPPDVEAGMTEVADGLPALHAAAKHGDLMVVKRLIASGEIDPCTQEPISNLAPLWLAARYGQPEVIDYLMRLPGMDWQCTDINGRNGIWAASFGGHLQAVDKLCEMITWLVDGKTMREFAQQTSHDHETPLFAAAQHGHIEVVSFLCERVRVGVDTARADGATPLFIAANNNHLAVVKYLVDEQGADTELARYDGRQPSPGVCAYTTPLRIAHHNGHIEVVKYLMGK